MTRALGVAGHLERVSVINRKGGAGYTATVAGVHPRFGNSIAVRERVGDLPEIAGQFPADQPAAFKPARQGGDVSSEWSAERRWRGLFPSDRSAMSNGWFPRCWD